MGRISAPGINPTRGVMAGDAMAMSPVSAFMLEGLKHVKDHLTPTTPYTIFVDDVQLQVGARMADLGATAIEAASSVSEALVGLGLDLNREKAAVICSDRSIAKQIAAGIGSSTDVSNMYWGRHIGVGCAPARSSRFVQTGSMLTIIGLQAT